MECKAALPAGLAIMGIVLIETLWNVKEYYPVSESGEGDCINRNIVECKVTFCTEQNTVSAVLIETLWNVKIVPNRSSLASLGINRNIVECKERKARK